MLKSVILALDGSEMAARAIPHAAEIAERIGGCLILLRVVPSESRAADRSKAEAGNSRLIDKNVLPHREQTATKSQAEAYLSSLKRSLLGKTVAIAVKVIEGEPGEKIVEEAGRHSDPLIVVTPFGRSAALLTNRESTMGSIATEVLQRSNVPVLVVR